MVDFVTHGEAVEVLKPFKLPSGDADFAAKLLRFFAHPALFSYALEHVSAALWDRYRQLEKDAPNRLSRIIGAQAFSMGFKLTNQTADHANDGKLAKADNNNSNATDGAPKKPFDPGERVQLRLVEKDLKFLELIKEGLVWKDSMDLWHGEWSHALQWLAATDYLGPRVPAFYRDVVPKYRAGELSLWSMLCDAFPLDDTSQKHPEEFKMRTDGYRSPQNVSRLLFGSSKPIKEHFLSHELTNHYHKRGLLNFKNTGYGEIPDVSQTKSRGTPSKDSQWELDVENPARHRLTKAPQAKHRAARLTDGQAVVFHGAKGLWYPRK